MRSLCVGVVAAVMVGCAQPAPATQVLVFVDAQPGVRAASDLLEIRVEGSAGREGSPFSQRELSEISEPRYPLRIALSPLDGDAERVYRLTATARDGTTAVAQTRVISGYVPGRTLRIDLVLDDACLGHAPCPEDQTCVAGSCRPAQVAPDTLPDIDEPRDASTPSDAASEDAGDAGERDGGIDAGTDAGMDAGMDAGSLDAGRDGSIDATLGDGCRPEVCNELDDDCDSRADEDFDLLRDPSHCGSCTTVCGMGEICGSGICGADVPWVTALGAGDPGAVQVTGAATDATGATFVMGSAHQDRVDIGTTMIPATSSMPYDFVVRVGPEGNIDWVVSHTRPAGTYGYDDVLVGPDGRVYVAIAVSGAGSEVWRGRTVAPYTQVIAALAPADGTVLAVRELVGANVPPIEEMEVLAGGDVLIAGARQTSTRNTVPGCPSATAVDTHGWVARLRADGSCAWAKWEAFPYRSSDLVRDLAMRPDGSACFTAGSERALIHCFDTIDGDLLWSREYVATGGTEQMVQIPAIVIGPTGGVYAAGRTAGTSYDLGGGPRTGSGFVLALAADGAYRWDRVLPNVLPQLIALDSDGDVLLAGTYRGGTSVGGPALPTPPGGGSYPFLAEYTPGNVWRWSVANSLPYDLRGWRAVRGGWVLAGTAHIGSLSFGGPSAAVDQSGFVARMLR